MLHGFQLMGYVLGEVELSTPTAIQQDQLILSWILTGISTAIIPQVAAYKTSARDMVMFTEIIRVGNPNATITHSVTTAINSRRWVDDG